MAKYQYNLAPDPVTPENSEPARTSISVPMSEPVTAKPEKDFEVLLRELDEMEQQSKDLPAQGGFRRQGYKFDRKYSKAEGNASYDDFIEMVKEKQSYCI